MEKLLNYSKKYDLKHIPSALSQYSYLKYLLPIIKKDFKIVIGKPFGAQAYYVIWEEMGYIKKDQELSYGVSQHDLSFIEYGEETLGNALGIAAGISLATNELTWCNLSDGALQMGPTLEAVQFISSQKLPVLLTIDCNEYQLTGSTKEILNLGTDKLYGLFSEFGWDVYELDLTPNTQTNISEFLNNIVKDFKNEFQKPVVILCRTIKGAGIEEMEKDPVQWHYKSLKDLK